MPFAWCAAPSTREGSSREGGRYGVAHVWTARENAVRHRPFEPSRHRLIPVASRTSRSARWAGVALALLMLALTAAHAQVGAGDRLVDQGRFEEAVARYDEAIAADGSNAAAYRQRARAQVYWADDLPSGEDDAKRRLYDLAITDAERAVELAPDDPGT